MEWVLGNNWMRAEEEGRKKRSRRMRKIRRGVLVLSWRCGRKW